MVDPGQTQSLRFTLMNTGNFAWPRGAQLEFRDCNRVSVLWLHQMKKKLLRPVPVGECITLCFKVDKLGKQGHSVNEVTLRWGATAVTSVTKLDSKIFLSRFRCQSSHSFSDTD